MKFTQSIRFRIILACIIFALIVTMIFGLILAVSIKINSDEQFNWHIEKEATHFLEQYKKNKNTSFASSRGSVFFINKTKAISKINETLGNRTNPTIKSLKDLDSLEFKMITKDGYFVYIFSQNGNKIYVLEAELDDSSSLNFYYVIDLSGFNRADNMGANISINIFFIMILIVLVFALAIGFYIAKKVLVPLTNLSSNVDKIDIGEYKSNTDEYYNDEIGFLAQKIDTFVNRTRDFVEREKAFTRDASHELRTPVASSLAALDVAYALIQSKDPKMKKILDRIQRANKNMTHLIESFLILGREKQKLTKKLTFYLRDLVNDSINKNSYLLNSLEIKYLNNIDKNIKLTLHKEYLSIVIDNIVRNAFVHMQEGVLNIDAKDGFLIVHDSGEWFNTINDVGIGLNIVKRICKEKNWNLSIVTTKNKGTMIKIQF